MTLVFRSLKGNVAMVTNFGGQTSKIALTHLYTAHWYSEIYWMFATAMHALTAIIKSVYIVYKFDEILSRNFGVYEAQFSGNWHIRPIISECTKPIFTKFVDWSVGWR